MMPVEHRIWDEIRKTFRRMYNELHGNEPQRDLLRINKNRINFDLEMSTYIYYRESNNRIAATAEKEKS